MLAHFVYFIRHDFSNRVKRQLSRLRSPKYAIALLVGLAYFFFAFGGQALFSDRPPDAEELDQSLRAFFGIAGPLMFALLAAYWWISSGPPQALAFKPAEVALLFTAPLTRTQLIQFKLLRGQVAIVLSALLFTIVARHTGLPWYLRFPSLWLLLSIIQLHQIVAGLVHVSASQHGVSGLRRSALPIAFFAGLLIAIGWGVARGLPALRAAIDDDAFVFALRDIFAAPPTSIGIAPFRVVVAPMLAATFTEWVVPFAIGLLVLAAHYLWVLRSDVAFEESAAEASAKVAAMVEAARAGRWGGVRRSKSKRVKKPWFVLHARGEPAVALFWKNFLFFTRQLSMLVPVIATLAAGMVFLMVYLESGEIAAARKAAGLVLLALATVLFVMGPLAVRNDLRMDLKKIELLRTLPVNGTRMVAAQLGASTASLLLAIALIALPGVLLIMPSPNGVLILAAAAGLLALPALVAIALAIQNGITLAFPAWVSIGADRVGGVEHIGQQVLTLVGAIALYAVALIPPLIFAGAAAGAFSPVWGRHVWLPALLVLIGALYAEVAAMVMGLGRMYERLDPVEAGLCR